MRDAQVLWGRLRASLIASLHLARTTVSGHPMDWRALLASPRTRAGRQKTWRAALPLLWLLLGLLAFDLYLFASRFIPSQFTKVTVAPLYVPVAVILAVLLLTPPRRWWLYLGVAYAFQVMLFTWFGYPFGFNLVAEAPTVLEPLIAAYLLYRLNLLSPTFASLREVTYFAACVIAAAMLSAFMGAGLRASLGFAYWPAWLSWFFADSLANLVLAPAFVLWAAAGAAGLRVPPRRRLVEITVWGGLFVLVGIIAQVALHGQADLLAFIYLPVPLLLWAALRFGPRALTSALALLTTVATIGVVYGLGPFDGLATAASVLTVQFFLAAIGIPLFFLAALVQERKQADVALQASETRYRSVVEAQTELITRFLPDMTVTFVNEANCRSMGRSREQLLGTKLLDLVPDAARELVATTIQSLLAHPGVATIEHQVRLADGSLGWHQWANRTILDEQGRVTELQGIGRDITERKRLEQEREAARLEAERRAEELDRVFEAVADGVAVYDQQGREVRTNAALHRLLRLDAAPAEYAQLSLHERMALFAARDERDRPLTSAEGPLARALCGEGLREPETMDIRSRTLDGREVELSVSAATLRDQDGQLAGAVAVFRDQTERRQLERERDEQADQLDRIFEGMTDALLIYDANGRTVRTNPAARRLLGMDAAPPDYAQLTVAERLARYAPRDAQGRLVTLEESASARALRGEAVTGSQAMGIQVRTFDGRTVELSASAAPLRDQEGHVTGAVAILHDQTERKRLAREREAARAEAERHAAELEATFEAMADGVAVFDRQGQQVRENAAQRRLLGLDAAPPDYAALSLSAQMELFVVRDEHDGPLRDPTRGPLPRALRGEVVSGAETRNIVMRTLDGREVEVGVSAAPLRDRDGQVTGAVTILRDQTERRRLERENAEQAEQLNRIIEGMADGVFVYDTQGRVVRSNAAARRLLGLDAAPPEFFELPAEERIALYAPRDGRDGHVLTPEEWLVTRALPGGDVLGEPEARDIRMRALDGRELEVSASVAPLRDQDGQVAGAILILNDRTARRRLEREREAARASELAWRETTRQMNEFLGITSHELKSPLATMKMTLQALSRRLYGPPSRPRQRAPAEQAEIIAQAQPFLASAERAVNRMVRLVTDLLEVTQLRVGALELQLAPADLTTIVGEAVAEQQQVHPARTVRLELPTPAQPAPVLVDADRIGQVVTNYLTNAVKYSPTDRPIVVRLEVADDGMARVSVHDEGPGIPADEQARVWELYHRVPGAQVYAGGGVGLGLGLHISRTIVERHGGHVGLASTPGQGSTFWFTLPLATAEGGEASTSAPSP